MKTFLFSILIIILLVEYACCQGNITHQTKLGSMRGIITTVKNETVYQFRKIPFAKPPIGNLRFQQPEKFGSWNQTLDATAFGPSCMQDKRTMSRQLPNNDISEDCLYLNIYVPRNLSPSNNKSVLIWVHGGAYIVGQGMKRDGSTLALTGDVIVVTINYRLGIFGFLSFGGPPAVGNYAMWDQQLAFWWVKLNIADYGGNPDSITIYGESAGGFSVSLHALHPGNQGLFQRVISDSGVGNSLVAYSRNIIKLVDDIGPLVNCTNRTVSLPQLYLECLSNKSAIDLQTAMNTLSTTYTQDVQMSSPIGPVIDGDFLKDDPVKLLNDKSSQSYQFFRSLDVMTGVNSGEGFLVLIFMNGYQPIFHFNITQGIPTSFLCDHMIPSLTRSYFNNNPYVAKAICDYYKVKAGNGNRISVQSMEIANMYGQVYFVVPAIQNLNFHSAGNTNKKSYLFYFTANTPPAFRLPAWFRGTPHGAELDVVFGSKNLPSELQQLSINMQKYWTNFVNTGNPNGADLPAWPVYNPSNYGTYVQLDQNITQGRNLFKNQVNFWLNEIPYILQHNTTGPPVVSTSTMQPMTSRRSQSSGPMTSPSTTGNPNPNAGKELQFSVILLLLCVLKSTLVY